MNTVKMLNADCLAEMAGIQYHSFPLVPTDIPYGEVNRRSNGLRNLDFRDAPAYGRPTIFTDCSGWSVHVTNTIQEIK